MNYLYNGVELPVLPKVEGYEYCSVITHTIFGTIYTDAYFSDRPCSKYEDSDSLASSVVGETSAETPITNFLVYRLNGGVWEYFISYEWTIFSLPYKTLIYTNYDLYIQDTDVIYLAASDPVPVSVPRWVHMNSFLKGLALGLAGKPLEFAKVKEPVAYLYNGVRLPKLPEWDKTAYPYAAIYTYHGASEAQNPIYRLIVSDGPFAIVHKTFVLLGKEYDALEWDGNYIAKWKIATWDYWDADGSGTGGSFFGLEDATDAVVWTNTDIHYADDYSTDETLADTVYLAASEPVPVYE